MDDGIVPSRTCTKCSELKPSTNDFFAKSKSGPLGLAYQCKECSKAYAKALRVANPGYAAEVAKRHRAKNPEKVRAYDRGRNARRKAYLRVKAAELRRLYPDQERERGRRWRKENAQALREYRRRYVQENSEKVSTYLRNWYLSNHAHAIEYAQRARAANPEKIRAAKSEWYVRNRVDLLEASKRWRIANPEKRRIYSQNRRARKMAHGGGLSLGIAKKLFALQRGRCACCGSKLVRYHLDHIMPLALGGKHEDSNMQLLTPRCNVKKGAKSPERFARERGLLI